MTQTLPSEGSFVGGSQNGKPTQKRSRIERSNLPLFVHIEDGPEVGVKKLARQVVASRRMDCYAVAYQFVLDTWSSYEHEFLDEILVRCQSQLEDGELSGEAREMVSRLGKKAIRDSAEQGD
jgi:hypothetical protein